jgi:hypothetical protein
MFKLDEKEQALAEAQKELNDKQIECLNLTNLVAEKAVELGMLKSKKK